MNGTNKILYRKNIVPSRLAALFLVINTWQIVLVLNNVNISDLLLFKTVTVYSKTRQSLHKTSLPHAITDRYVWSTEGHKCKC
jgi:hypothetical protein